MGVDHYSESGCLLLAHSLFAAELKHATTNRILPDKELNAQRFVAKRLLVDDPARMMLLKHLIKICSKTREELETMVAKAKSRCPNEFQVLQPWVGDFVLAQIASSANTILTRFGVPAIGEGRVVSRFVDPMQGYDDFPNEPLQMYFWFPPNDLWANNAELNGSTALLCKFAGVRPASLREKAWVSIDF